MRFPPNRSLRLLLAVTAASLPFLAAGCACERSATAASDTANADTANADTANPEAVNSGALSASGRVAYVDPDSGRLTYTKPRTRSGREPLALSPEFVEAIRADHADVVFRTLPDGTQLATRDKGFRAALVATVDPDGRVTTTHVAAGAPETSETKNGGADDAR